MNWKNLLIHRFNCYNQGSLTLLFGRKDLMRMKAARRKANP